MSVTRRGSFGTSQPRYHNKPQKYQKHDINHIQLAAFKANLSVLLLSTKII